MTDYKITQLTSASTIALTDVIPFVSSPANNPVTEQITVANLFTSPTLAGIPTAPTQSTHDSSTKIATTAYVENQDSWVIDSDTWLVYDTTHFYIQYKDATVKFPVGTKIGLINNNTWKWFYVTAATHNGTSPTDYTLVTLLGDNGNNLVSGAITASRYSYTSSPPSFPILFSFPSTITAASGTLTSASVTSFKFQILGKFLYYNIRLVITTNGTGGTNLVITAPLLVYDVCTITGVKTGVVSVIGYALSNTMALYKYDGTYPGGDGVEIRLTGSYQAFG
jgi:hypothetical protein